MTNKVTISLFVIFTISILVFSGFSIFIPVSPGADQQDDHGDTLSSRQGWRLSKEIEKTIEIPKSNDHYFELDTVSGTLREKEMPAPDAGLNTTALEALSKVPAWLHDDLALKFRELASRVLSAPGTASPALADCDNDGDLDLILGQGTGGLMYYENSGTSSLPLFVQAPTFFDTVDSIATELLGQFEDVTPTTADIDNDFDVDIIAGHVDGGVVLIENSGSPDSPLFENIEIIQNIDVTSNSAPYLVDYDIDGDFDLAVGDGVGRVHYYMNAGTAVEPLWNRAMNNPLAEVQVAGNAAPVIYDMDNDGDLDITVGDTTDSISYYRCYRGGLNPDYVLDETMYLGINVGTDNHPLIADMDNDGLVEFMTGSSQNEDSSILYHFENYGSVANPQWNIWSSYKVVPGVSYYPTVEFITYFYHRSADRFADIILKAYNTNPKYVDEVAYPIAYSDRMTLGLMNDEMIEMFLENAEYLYEIDNFLQYANIKEHNLGTEDYYSTVEYKTLENGVARTREYPRDIYYNYIVHPKISEETPGYIDPDTGGFASKDNGGRFWREYLFYHNDDAYPVDFSGAPDDGIDDYPTSFGPPLLKTLLSDVKYLWNGSRFTAPGGRPESYGDNAIIRVSNWVGKTLILNQQEVSDGERPVQPVRIAHHHNGNCGELGDLTTAAARTALIATSEISLVAEDHCWNEFYETGWRHWDNHWSDSGSHIYKFDMYWVGWNKRGGSGIWKHEPDSDTTDVTHHYVPATSQVRVIVSVLDRNGFPVDGARVLFGSHWMAEQNIDQVDATFPFPGIWNYTDTDGFSEFRLARQNFTIKVVSKIGNAVQEKTYIGEGGTYYFNFTLEGAKPRPRPNGGPMAYTPPTDPAYKIELELSVLGGVQYPPNPESGGYHPEDQTQSNKVDFFITDSNFITNYRSGFGFQAIDFKEDITDYQSPEFSFAAFTSWYFVLSNLDSIETAKVISLKIRLYQPHKDEPYISINSPLNNSNAFVGSKVNFEGSVEDEDGIRSIWLSLKNTGTNEVVLNKQLSYNDDENWFYEWDTTKFDEGTYLVEVTAEDNKGLKSHARIFLFLILAGAPEITFTHPFPNDQFYIGDIIEINGTAYDNGYIKSLRITLGGDTTFDITSSYNAGFWDYFWDTKFEDEGAQEITVSAVDNDDKSASVSIIINLVEPPVPPDVTLPELSFLRPTSGDKFTQGTIVAIEGYAFDDRELARIYMTFGQGTDENDAELSEDGEWSYLWDTTSVTTGVILIYAHAQDTTGNAASENVSVTIIPPPPPVDNDPPAVRIDLPIDDAKVSAGVKLVISGTAVDAFGVTKFELTLDDGDTWTDITTSITGGSWHYTLDTASPLLWPNLYEIEVRAFDAAGNSDSAVVSIFVVDDTSPEVEILLPVDGSEAEQGTLVELTGFASDNFKLDKLQVRTNDARRWKDYSKALDRESGSFSIVVDTSVLDTGTNTIRVRAEDIYGNEVEESVTIKVLKSSDSGTDRDVVDSTSDFLLFSREGNIFCGILLLIIIIAAFAVMRPKRRR